MLEYEKIRTNETRFLAMTGLMPNEFEYLCDHFEPHWQLFYRYHKLDGTSRQHPAFTEYRNTSLPGTANKLFFLMNYLKTYPLQQFQAASFGISQGKVSKWIDVLLVQLDRTLEGLGCAPCTDPEKIADTLKDLGAATVNLDATERPVGRSVDQDVQKEYYSGKKKTIR